MRTIHLQALDIMVAARVSISIQRMFRALQQPQQMEKVNAVRVTVIQTMAKHQLVNR
ncbi:MAG: hypothetical protein ACLUR5_07625 [Eubacterium ventriosum]